MTATHPKFVKPLLLTASIASGGMAAFHFFLPAVYQWSRYMANVPDSIRWGMAAINAFFSFLLLLGSAATIRFALSSGRDRSILWGMAAFWIFNVVYQLIWPFPLRVVWIATLTFAGLMTAAHLVAIWLLRVESGEWRAR